MPNPPKPNEGVKTFIQRRNAAYKQFPMSGADYIPSGAEMGVIIDMLNTHEELLVAQQQHIAELEERIKKLENPPCEIDHTNAVAYVCDFCGKSKNTELL